MAKRRPSVKTAPRKPSGKRGAVAGSSWKWRAVEAALMLAMVIGFTVAVGYLTTPRGIDPPPYPVVTLDDTPGDAVLKSHARYLIDWASSLDEFAERADSFEESGAAAAWFAERTAKARKDAYASKGGFDAYVFGHAGGTDSGEDRYDAETLATGAKEMAEACRKAAASIAAGR